MPIRCKRQLTGLKGASHFVTSAADRFGGFVKAGLVAIGVQLLLSLLAKILTSTSVILVLLNGH